MIGNESITGSIGETENLKGSLTNANSLDGSVNNSGTLIQEYTLPVASANTLGGIKVGANLSIDADGTLNATASGGSVEFKGLPTYAEVGNGTFDFTKKEVGVYSYANLTSIYLPNGNLFTPTIKSTTLYYITDYKEVTQTTVIAFLESEIKSTSNKLQRIRTEFEYNPTNKNISAKESIENMVEIPTKTSQLTNDSSYASESYVTNAIANAQLGGGDTEIDLSGYATKDDLLNKVDKVTGKSLISDSEITRLANVTNYDDTGIKNTLNSKADTSAIPTKVSQLSNDKGYLTEHQDISNLALKSELHSHSNKSVLDGITSAKITSWDNKSNFSGSYNDLTNKPTIPTVPTKVSAFTNDAGYLTSIPSEYVTESEMNEAISNLGGGTGNVSSNTVNSIMVVDELPETEVEGVLYLVKESVAEDDGNLYDYDTATVLIASVSQSSNSIKASSTGTSRTTYLQVEPNTTYKVEKVSDTVFTIGTTIEEPVTGVSLTGINKNETGATELTITTNATDNYLAIWYHSTECSLDEDTIRKSIVVTKVS